MNQFAAMPQIVVYGKTTCRWQSFLFDEKKVLDLVAKRSVFRKAANCDASAESDEIIEKIKNFLKTYRFFQTPLL